MNIIRTMKLLSVKDKVFFSRVRNYDFCPRGYASLQLWVEVAYVSQLKSFDKSADREGYLAQAIRTRSIVTLE